MRSQADANSLHVFGYGQQRGESGQPGFPLATLRLWGEQTYDEMHLGYVEYVRHGT